ncbi:5-oxoprolinase subunit PxpB [Phnomibacter ginsenosidimutans]|nr:5-oxoprolinase subunit PxpB [Phnomibacter ginsenosidimutans]
MYLSPAGLTFEAMQLPPPHISPLSETDWLLQFHTGLSVAANQQLHELASLFRQQYSRLLQDVVVAYDSLLLRFHQPQPDADVWMHDGLKQLADKLSTGATTTLIEIPVCYDQALRNDLAAMAQQINLSAAEIVQLHSAATYHIYMLGFLPGFAYMGSVDERIALPRKAAPVPVKAGAVGIAGMQTGIYPTASPGGWNIVGYTPLQMFDVHREPACVLQPGQQVRFVPVSLSDFKSLQAS